MLYLLENVFEQLSATRPTTGVLRDCFGDSLSHFFLTPSIGISINLLILASP
jgi:hypothetical protein